jgi:single-strand DNA-binding protein
MELKGKVKVINDEQTFDSGFTKREFVVTTQEQYPQDIKFELFKEKTALITSFGIGDEIIVHFDIRGNEYNGKYYVNLVSWKLEAVGAPAPAATAPAGGPPASDAPFPTVDPVDLNVEEDDDLPF